MHTKVVNFEAAIRPTKAAYERLGRALVEGPAQLVDSAAFTGDPVLLLRCEPRLAERVRGLLQPIDWIYRSPTRLENGSMRPLYMTPEEEIAAPEVA